MTVHIDRIANGVTVAVEPMAGFETAAIGIYIDRGSRSESPVRGGLAHLVEHMVFKGAGGRDARRIAEDIEDVGGTLNAWTARDHTVFHARLMPADLALGLDMIADLVREPWFRDADLDRERQVVLSELGESRDTPDDIVFDHLHQAAFGATPFGSPVLGAEQTINAIATDDLRHWASDQYKPENLIVAAAGKVDPDQILQLAERRLGDLARQCAAPPPPAQFAGGGIDDARPFDQVNIALAWPGLAMTDPDAVALSLYTAIVGGGSASRLFQRVREERGLAYSVYAWSQGFADCGVFGAYVATGAEDAVAAEALVREVLAQSIGSIGGGELLRAKTQARAGLMMGLEGVAARCDHLARLIQIHGRHVPEAELIAQIDAVTLDDIHRIAAATLAGPEARARVGIVA